MPRNSVDLTRRVILAEGGYWGFHAVPGGLAGIGPGVGAALAVALVWGALLAPASEMRLQGDA